MTRPASGVAAGLLAVSCLALAACGSHAGTPPPSLRTQSGPSTGTSAVEAPRLAVYRFARVAVRVAFEGAPVMSMNPATLTPLLPDHTNVASWSVGDLGALEPPSYELVIASFPAGSSGTDLDRFLSRYAGEPNTTIHGRPGLHKLSVIPLASRKGYSGITAFSVGRVLVMAVGLDTARASLLRWLGSLQLVSAVSHPAR